MRNGPDLNFRVESAEPLAHAAAPHVVLKLRVTDAAGAEAAPVHSIVLRCQVRIESARRRYTPAEQERLVDLFGQPHRWGQTLRSMLWAHVTAAVPGFTGETAVDLHVPCTFDFNVAAAKYFDALADGEVPVSLLFSGTVFHAAGDDGALRVAQIPWKKEATFKLPVSVWRRMMDLYYPNTAWLCLRKDVFDRLHEYKMRRGIATWEQAVERVLAEAGANPGAGVAP